VDLSRSFVEAARVLNAHWDGSAEIAFVQGDATRLTFDAETFDVAFLQHVAMNVADRAALYTGIRRVLRPGGRLAVYDVVRGSGEIVYPVPWAPTADMSFLLSETETSDALAAAGFRRTVWRIETAVALAWFDEIAAVPPAPNAVNLGGVLGPGVAPAVANFRSNLARGAIGILAAVLERA
jgi:SAM-dependent methyltransferase